MSQPAWNRNSQQQTGSGGFFVWLGDNIIPVGVLLVLIAVGITAFLALKNTGRQGTSEAEEKPQLTLKDFRDARSGSPYADADCTKDLHCRQLKRISADGGASPEAVRKNLLAADRSITFEQLQANANRYAGTAWAFEGKIQDTSGHDKNFGYYSRPMLTIEVGPGKRIYVSGELESRFSAGDYVYVVGYIAGANYPQLSSMKNETVVPSVTARALLTPSEAREILYGPGTN